jgi:hypothetical protein
MTPSEARQLAKQLFGEEFEKDRRAAILKALAWLDEAANASDNAPVTSESASPGRHPLVGQLATYITTHELSYEAIGEQIGAGSTSIGGWLRGTTPKASSLAKIRAFLKQAGALAGEKQLTAGESRVAELAEDPQHRTQILTRNQGTTMSAEYYDKRLETIRMFINCDYRGETRANLEEEFTPLVQQWVAKDIADSFQAFKKSGGAAYSHVQTHITNHTIDDERVLILLGTHIERGATSVEGACHIGPEKRVRTIEARCREHMKEMADKLKGSLIIQVDPVEEM